MLWNFWKGPRDGRCQILPIRSCRGFARGRRGDIHPTNCCVDRETNSLGQKQEDSMSAADHIEFLSRRIAELDERIAAAREYGPEFRALTKRRSIYIADRALLMRATLRRAA